MPYEMLRVTIPCFSFSLCRGESLCFFTEDLASKRLLLDILCGHRRPEHGHILLEDQVLSLDNYTAACSHGIYLISYTHSHSNMNIAENLFLTNPDYYSGLSVQKTGFMHENAARLLKRYHLDYLDPADRMSTLSSIDQYCISILHAAASGAKILILDDPALFAEETDGLQRIFFVLKELCEQGISLLCFLSGQNSLLKIFDRCGVIRDGVITQIGSPEEVLPFISSAERFPFSALSALAGGDSHTGDGSADASRCSIKIHCRKQIRPSASPSGSLYDAVPDREKGIRVEVSDMHFHVKRAETTGICCRSGELADFRAFAGSTEKPAAIIERDADYPRIFPYMSLYDNITLLMNQPVYNRFSIMNSRIRNHLAKAALEKLNASDLAERYGGRSFLLSVPPFDQLLIELAKWLCAGTEIFLFIKRTENGTYLPSAQSKDLFMRLNKAGATCIVISRSEEMLRSISSRVIII